MAQPAGDRAHIGAAGGRGGRGEMPKLMEVNRQPDLVGQTLVLVRQAVGQARLRPVRRPGQDERVVDQLDTDRSGIVLLLDPTPSQERSQGIVNREVTRWWVLVGPSLTCRFTTVSDRAMASVPFDQLTSLQRSAHSSPRRAPVIAASTTATASTVSVFSASAINSCTSATAGADAVE